MGISISEMACNLKDDMAWQQTPEPIADRQYEKMIIHGLKRLYIDTNRPSLYQEDKFHRENGELFYDAELPVNEQEYIIVCARIDFFKKVQTDVNNAFSYSTDALTVTHADKPYANLRNSLEDLEMDRRILYYKMVTYTLG